MTGSPADLVRELYAAVNVGDFARVEELTDPDLEWIPDPRIPEGPFRGREQVIAFFRDRAESFEEFVTEVEQLEVRARGVLALVRVTGRGHASGAEFEIRIAHLWEVHDGRVIRGRGFGDRDQARQAAGL